MYFFCESDGTGSQSLQAIKPGKTSTINWETIHLSFHHNEITTVSELKSVVSLLVGSSRKSCLIYLPKGT